MIKPQGFRNLGGRLFTVLAMCSVFFCVSYGSAPNSEIPKQNTKQRLFKHHYENSSGKKIFERSDRLRAETTFKYDETGNLYESLRKRSKGDPQHSGLFIKPIENWFAVSINRSMGKLEYVRQTEQMEGVSE